MFVCLSVALENFYTLLISLLSSLFLKSSHRQSLSVTGRSPQSLKLVLAEVVEVTFPSSLSLSLSSLCLVMQTGAAVAVAVAGDGTK